MELGWRKQKRSQARRRTRARRIIAETADLRNMVRRGQARAGRYTAGEQDVGAQYQLRTALQPRMRTAVRRARRTPAPPLGQDGIDRAGHGVARVCHAKSARYP